MWKQELNTKGETHAPTEGFYQWTQEVRSRFPHLSRPQATVLALVHRLAAPLPCQGVRFCYRGELYERKTARWEVTLLGFWEAGYERRWLLATDLDQGQAVAAIYAFRSWIEQGFRLIKRRGLSLFWQGACRIVACLIQGEPLPLGRFLHQSWPQVG